MTAFYNDNDPFTADWLESLIAHGYIAPGQVDRRSIADLTPADVSGPGQRHFFAGIGGWSYALRLAGVPDDAPIWTGSCPCQPFSDAGQGQGVLDPRHLWPAWFALIEECRPPILFGEQVASKDGLGWLDVVFSDLERCGYTVGATDLCAAGVGAPHVRQRLYFVAYADGQSRGLLLREREPRDPNAQTLGGGKDCACWDPQCMHRKYGYPMSAGQRRADGSVVTLADANRERLEVERLQQARTQRETVERGGPSIGMADSGRACRTPRTQQGSRSTDPRGRKQAASDDQSGGAARSMADPDCLGRQESGRVLPAGKSDDAGTGNPGSRRQSGRGRTNVRARRQGPEHGQDRLVGDPSSTGSGRHPGAVPGEEAADQGGRNAHRRVLDIPVPAGAVGGFWADAEWILCRDPGGGPPVARPVKPGLEPLVARVPGRVGLLRGYGNSIVTEVAAEFILAALDAIKEIS